MLSAPSSFSRTVRLQPARSSYSPYRQWQTGCMRNLIFVAFVEPVFEGQVFPRSDWPLHITLVRFDVEGPADADAPLGHSDDIAGLVAELAGPSAQAALGAVLTVGQDAGFGRLGSVPVSLLEPSPHLDALHRDLFRAVAAVGGRVSTPDYVLDLWLLTIFGGVLFSLCVAEGSPLVRNRLGCRVRLGNSFYPRCVVVAAHSDGDY